jgi:hypothetical protein
VVGRNAADKASHDGSEICMVKDVEFKKVNVALENRLDTQRWVN